MKTSTKLKVLRAVSGLFSWGWIIAALIGVYCLVAAIGFGGSWVNVFIAFGTSGISKWLARGFSKSHVWTAPSWQGKTLRRRLGRCSHVSGLFVRLT